MLRIQATIGLTTYYFASEALDYDNRYWEPRISNAFQISRSFNASDKSGNKIRSLDVSLDNRDGFFNAIYAASGLVNAKFTFFLNEGDNVVKKFTGRVTKISSFGDDVSLNVREVGYEYLKEKFPDAQIAYDYYSSSGINESWNAIPIHFGTVNRYPTPWINLFESHFMIGSGPIHAVKKIYFDKTVVYDSSTGKNGYKPTPESPEIKFRIFKGGRVGVPDVVDGITSPYPGFAFIQLYKMDGATEVPADPVNPDGEAVQIYVDIEGIQNDSQTGPERNPAQILYQIFTKPYTAEEGYGLGIEDGVDADFDFASAITECNIQAFKIDGSIDNTTEFGEWVDEILRCCRGQLYENDGKITCRIDAAAAAPTIHFDETGEQGYDCTVETWTEPERDAQTNRVRLSYSWNFENSNFNKKPSYNQESPIGDTNLVDSALALKIGKWNTETLEYKLIKDDTTAHKLAQYYLKNISKQLITTSLTTEVNIPNTVTEGSVIKLTSPKYGWVEKQFRITNISRAEENTEIELKEYSSSVFTFVDPGTGAESTGNQYSAYNIPDKPEMVSLTKVSELQADGSTQTRINVTFVKPTENAAFVGLYYKLASEPESSFKILETTADATTISAIWKGIETGNYNFRLVSISSVGIYSDLTVVAGDKHYYGQPNAETYLSLTGDTTAPGKPVITATNPVNGGVSFYIDITGGVPSDFSHFMIYRKVGAGDLTLIDSNYSGQLFTDSDRSAGYDARQYAVIAVDKTGNPSVQSDLSGSVVPLQINTVDIYAGAITSEKITSGQIISKDFRTACNVGSGVTGVLFNSAGIQAWNNTSNTFNLDAATGNVSMTGTITALAGCIGGFCADPTDGLYAGAGATRVQMKAGAGFWAGATNQVDAPFSVTQAGAIKSTSGVIGGFTINGTEGLYAGTGATRVQMKAGAGFWAGATAQNDALFSVTQAGAVKAVSGIIGGWSLATGCLYATNAKMYSGAANTARVEFGTGACSAGINSANAGTDISFWAGSTFANRATAPFRVTAAGAITANCGKIANWFIKPNRLCAVAADGAEMTIGGNTGQPLIWLGSSSGSNQVTIGECVYTGAWNPNKWGIVARFGASNLFQVHACCDGTCICASIAGWNFNNTQLYSTGCGLILCNTGAIQTGSFVTGNTGWKIDYLGNAEFNNICARGAIRTAVFIKDQISVIGGRTLIRPAGVSTLDCNPGADTFNIHLGSTIDQFAINDLIRIKDGAGDFWACVSACNGASQCLTVVKTSGTRFAFTKGQAIVNYGAKTGCGGILLDGQAPYIDLYTHDGTPWCGTCSRGRMGNLNGWGSFSTNTYGLALGSPTGNYMTYDSVSGNLNILGNINVCSTLPLSMPGGAVLDISAKGSTTATIALTGGVKDVSGNANNGTAYNGVAVVDSDIGKAFSFDGSDDYISISNPLATIGLGDFALSVWIKNPNYAGKATSYLATKCAFSTTGAGLFIAAASNPQSVFIDIGDGSTGGTGLNTGLSALSTQFDHIVISRISGVLNIYANGNFVTSATRNVNINTASALLVGKGYNYAALNGFISNLKVFNRALTPEEVKTLYLIGNQQESGTITADRVQTGTLQSINWGASAGSRFNLNDGTFAMGGSSAPKLCWNGTTLSVTGNITLAAGSSGYSTLTDKPTSLSGINSTEGTKLAGIAAGATVGATWGTNLNNIPATLRTPSGTGLFLSSTNLGYYNSGTWLTYMDNTGKFYLGGTSGKLQWDGTTLNINGNISVNSTLPLSMPGGAVLDISAKGSTTATIALTGGVKDVSGNGNNGQAYGGVAVVDSEIGKAFGFDGANDYITTGYNYGAGGTWDNPITFSIWMCVDSSLVWSTGNNNGWFGTGSYEGSIGIYSAINQNNVVGMKVRTNAGDYGATTTILRNQLTHLVGIWDGVNTISIYKNGVFVTSTSVTKSGVPDNGVIRLGYPHTFGGGSDVKYFKGKMAHPKIFNRALTPEEVKTLYLIGNQQESGTITADRVITGELKSANHSTTVGSLLDLNSGNLTIGGSSAPVFSTNATAKTGSLAGWDFNAACIYKGNLILNSSGAISGCYNSTALTGWCIDAAGNATFNNATVRGTVCASLGNIGGWSISPYWIRKNALDGASMQIGGNTGQALLWAGASSGSNQITLGECVYNGAWNPNKWGIVARFGGENLFQVHACCDGTCRCAQIAGWDFNSSCLYKGNLILNSSGAISGCYSGDTTGWCIDAAGNAKFNNAKLNNALISGTVYANSGQISTFSILTTGLESCSQFIGGYELARIKSSVLETPAFETIYVCCSAVTCVSIGARTGANSSISPILISLPATSNYALCTNGRIQAGQLSSPIVCGTTCVTSPIVCGTTCICSPVICSNCFVGPGIGTGTVKAWINFNGTGTIAIRGSAGVSAIVDCGTGYYRINFKTAMANANYVAAGTAGPSPAYLNFPYNTAAYQTTYYLVGTGSYSAMADACFVSLAFIQ